MDRNIITKNDAIDIRRRARELRDAASPGQHQSTEAAKLGGGLDADAKPDAWFQRLAKYIPGEALGLYFGLAGLFGANDLPGARGTVILVVVLVVCLVFNTLYLRRLWRVKRWAQVAISGAALLAYAFASGGALVQQLPFYEPRVGTGVIIFVSACLAFFDPPSPVSVS